jgi:ribokinase
MGRITIIGSSNMDLTVRTPHIPAKGETIFGGDVMMSFGGKGANQAVAVARLGGEATFISKVGTDANGKMMVEHFAEEGLCTDTVIQDPTVQSGSAWICVGDDGDNSIIVMPGANGAMTVEDLKPFEDAIISSEYLLMQLEVPMAVVEYAADLAHAAGVKVVLNPAPAAPLKDSLLSKLYALTPNETECRILCGTEASDDDEANAAVLYNKGVKNVIVTLGDKGSMLYNAEGVVTVPAQKVTAVDTVAAGDTYNGALCVALSKGKSFVEAMEFATAASAIAVTRIGAQASIPFASELK